MLDVRQKMKKLSQADKIALETASISIGDLPEGYHNFFILIWRVFNLGREYEKHFLPNKANPSDPRKPAGG